uniref:Uncharacterized protein n=1 Tax=Rhizophagus irregularis (strain DAOM 181602 / DAOM 197198 / MUCL 43194) TaxID=747089 RepID=U9SWZ6_RHIID
MYNGFKCQAYKELTKDEAEIDEAVRIEKNVTPKNRLDVIEEQLKEWNVTREEWSEAVNSDKLEKHVKKYPRTKKII